MRVRLEYLPRGIAAGNAHDPAAGVTAGSAEEQAVDGRPVLSRARYWTNHQELIESQIPVMPMPAADAKLLLHIGRGQQLRTYDAAAKAWGQSLQRFQHHLDEALSTALPALLERI